MATGHANYVLENGWNDCDKNKGHKGFIPAPKFTINDLPKAVKDTTVLEYIQAISLLTVRLVVRHPSGGGAHVGTGRVLEVVGKPSVGPCECRGCNSQTGHRQHGWKLFISTALHVISSSEEAKNTKVELFFDDEKSRTDGRVKSFWGLKVLKTDLQNDWCMFECITHGYDLAVLIAQTLDQLTRIRHRLYIGWPTLSSFNKVVVIVSHPHGKPKKITIGEIKDVCFEQPSNSRSGTSNESTPHSSVSYKQCIVSYSTGTCKGSSGATVLWLGIIPGRMAWHMPEYVSFWLLGCETGISAGWWACWLCGFTIGASFGFTLGYLFCFIFLHIFLWGGFCLFSCCEICGLGFLFTSKFVNFLFFGGFLVETTKFMYKNAIGWVSGLYLGRCVGYLLGQVLRPLLRLLQGWLWGALRGLVIGTCISFGLGAVADTFKLEIGIFLGILISSMIFAVWFKINVGVWMWSGPGLWEGFRSGLEGGLEAGLSSKTSAPTDDAKTGSLLTFVHRGQFSGENKSFMGVFESN